MKNISIKILLTQPWAYGLLLVVILASLGYDYNVLGLVLIIGIVSSWLNEIRKPSRMKTNYTVKKGKSYSFHRPAFHFGADTMEGEFTFWDKCEYPAHAKNLGQINKITGIGWGHHHENSVRIGVVYDQMGGHDLYVYCYIDGYRVKRHLYKTISGEKIKYELGYKNGNIFIYLFDRINEPIASWNQVVSIKPKPGFYLFPYHENAPLDWKVELQFYR
ncbi:hypothetical protein N9924_00245 [bacterium]|nr:hypothetical protein [bacterium]